MAIDLINYAFIRGKWYSLPDPTTAQQAIQKYNGNANSIRTRKPAGVLIDESLLNLNINQWPDAVADAVGVTGDALINPPYNPIIGPVTEEVAQTPAVTPPSAGPPSPSGPSPEQPEVDPWANLDQGKLNLAKRYADAGMMGRAATAFKDAGGTWDRTTSQRLRTEARNTSRYGGDFDFSKYGIKQRDFGTISEAAKAGQFAKIRKMVGKDNWSPELRSKLAAEYVGKGDDQPVRKQVPTPQLYKTGSKDWNQQFKGSRADIEGKFAKGTGNRGAAKEWRQRHLANIEEKYTGKERQTKRENVRRRHKIMIGK
jgi:hypothetical protein|tara:strand:- start:875 stop:1813 length:939 start_codon:yes stop_codon:yes gene_type:complete